MNKANHHLVCLVASIPIATAAANAQVPWLEAIERRLAVTTKVIGAMKAIKMAGLVDTMSSSVSGLRSSEIRASRRHRILNIFATLTC